MAKLLPQTVTFGRLTVFYYDGSSQYWEWTPCVKGSVPWRDFLRWYHGRTASACYVHPHDCGSTLIQRHQIKSYQTWYGEREK